MKKAIGMFAALMVALAMTGVGFAHWSQTLYIGGTVGSGNLAVGLRDLGVNDTGLDPGFDEETDTQIWYDKDVGSITSTNVTWKFTKDDVGYFEEEVITIENAYPSYAPGWTTAIANGGTIPVKISSWVMDPPIEEWPIWIELLKWEKWIWDPIDEIWVQEAKGASHPIPGYTMYGAGCYDALLEALMGQQLEPCDTIQVYIELHTTQEFGEMPMGADFDFDIDVEFMQWNLVP